MQAYRYYRWYGEASSSSYFHLYNIKLYDETDTVYTIPGAGQTVTASSVYDSTNTGQTLFYSVTDLSHTWHTSGAAFPQWIKIDLGVSGSKILSKYVLTTRPDAHYPSAWKFQGSNNDVDWTTLHSVTGYAWGGVYTKTFLMPEFSSLVISQLDAHLLAYYKLNETSGSTLSDLLGTYPLTITGTPNFSQITLFPFSYGQSIDFNGASASGSFVSLNGLSDVLIGLFIKTSTPSQTVLSKSGVFSLEIDADGKLVFTINGYSLTSTSVVTTNLPIQVLCIFQSNKLEIVLNGVQDAVQNFKASSQFNISLLIDPSANLTNTTIQEVEDSYALTVDSTDHLVLTTADGVCTSNMRVSNVSSVITSADGITWTQPSLLSGNWSSIAYGGGLFVAVSSDSNSAMTSPDGVTWTQRTLPAVANWTAVGYGGGVFVAVSSGSNIAATSPDGVTWTQRTIPSGTWLSVCYGNSKFVVVGYGDQVYSINGTTTTSIYSTDLGVTWGSIGIPSVASWNPFATWVGTFQTNTGYFVAMPNQGGYGVYSIDPSSSWGGGAATIPNPYHWSAITFGGTKAVALARNTTTSAYTTNSSLWTAATLPVSANWKCAAYGNSTYLGIATNSNIAVTSTDGITWTQRALPKVSWWNGVAFGNGIFVAVSGFKQLPVVGLSDPYSINLYINGIHESRFVLNNTITDAGTQPLVIGPLTGTLDEIFISKQLLDPQYLYNLAYDIPYENQFVGSESDYLDPGAPPSDPLNHIYPSNESQNGLDCYDGSDITYSVSANPIPILFVRAPFVTVEGSVTVEATPTSRKVLLMERSNKRVVRSTWSDPVTGYYSFTDIKAGDYIIWSDVWMTPIPTDFRGPGKIWGVVDDVNILPLSVRLVLLEHSTYRLVAFTMSDPTTGYYEFNNLSTSTVFTLIAENEDFHYNYIVRAKVHAV